VRLLFRRLPHAPTMPMWRSLARSRVRAQPPRAHRGPKFTKRGEDLLPPRSTTLSNFIALRRLTPEISLTKCLADTETVNDITASTIWPIMCLVGRIPCSTSTSIVSIASYFESLLRRLGWHVFIGITQLYLPASCLHVCILLRFLVVLLLSS